MIDHVRYLLLQVRNPEDAMRDEEIKSFCRVLSITAEHLTAFDLLSSAPSPTLLKSHDILLFGGSGEYSAVGEGAWLDRTLDVMREVYELAKPTFASCWGFQAMARALGGEVIHDLDRAEIGTVEIFLTEEGERDPIFSPLGQTFLGQMGHEDSVVKLPQGAVRLARSQRVENQAYKFPDRPIYCTQFHPELNLDDLHRRVVAYPKYIERIAGMPVERFEELLQPTEETESLLTRFVERSLA